MYYALRITYYTLRIMKNICFFNSNKAWGGGEKWHHDIALRFKNKGWPVLVITNTQSALYDRLQHEKIRLFQIKISNLSFLNIFKVLTIRRVLKEHNIDTILLNLPSDVKAGGIAAKLAGVKKIIYRRGLDRPIKKTFLNRFLFKRILTGVIVNSKETRRRILQNTPSLISKENIQVIYNGVDLQEYDREQATRIYTKHDNEIVLGNAGRLVEQKGQKYLIELAAVLKKRGVRFKLLIAGEGKLEKPLKHYAQTRNVGKEVVFVGFIERIKDFMESIDIFLLSSLFEGFGYVLVEAMAASKPVIAFNVSSNPEIVIDGHTGFLVEKGNISELAKRTEELMKNGTKRKTFGMNARKRVEEKFAIQGIVAEVIKLIEES
jgi:glycosyltransferase involved in cell wall biosynthesis